MADLLLVAATERELLAAGAQRLCCGIERWKPLLATAQALAQRRHAAVLHVVNRRRHQLQPGTLVIGLEAIYRRHRPLERRVPDRSAAGLRSIWRVERQMRRQEAQAEQCPAQSVNKGPEAVFDSGRRSGDKQRDAGEAEDADEYWRKAQAS